MKGTDPGTETRDPTRPAEGASPAGAAAGAQAAPRQASGPRAGFETRVLGAFVAAALVVSTLFAVTWMVVREAAESARRVAHAHQVLGALHSAEAELHNAISAVRGHAITGDRMFLIERDEALAYLEGHVLRLKRLTADDPVQQGHWRRLREGVDTRVALMERTAQFRETGGFEAVRTMLLAGLAREASRGLASVLAAMKAEEQRLLGERLAEQARVREVAIATGAGAALALVILLSSTFVFIRRQMRVTEASRNALAESEEGLATTLNSIGDAVLATDIRGRVTRMNPVAERLTGWTLSEATGRPVGEVFRIVNEHTREPAEVPVARVIATGLVQGLVNHTVLIARDGSECPVADSAAPIHDAARRVSGVVLVFRDATAERRAERETRDQNERLEARVRERTAQLRESEARLTTVFEHLAEGVVVSDLEGQVLYFNRAAVAMFGFSSRDDYLRRLPEFADSVAIATPGGIVLPVEEWPLARVLRGEELRDVELRTRLVRLGREDVFSYTGTLVRDADGGPTLAILAIRDVTEHRRAEDEIRALNRDLEARVAQRTAQVEEANRAKSDFLANMSHELRTPLNSIIGFSEMLKDGILGDLGEKQRGFVTDIFEAGTHLLSLINDILDLSKVEAGMLRYEPEAVDVPSLLASATLVVREKALAHGIGLHTRLEPTVGTMLADERKLKQIVYNLLSNAVKFTAERGAVTLGARRCLRSEVALDGALPGRMLPLPPGEDGEFLAITVEDTGVGIAEDDLPRLFEPFVQVDSSVSRRHEGTGLGLSLVRRLAELHGGTVGVSSRPGDGSRFCVWLPYHATAAVAKDERPPEDQAAPRPAPAVPLALVVEDDDRMAELISAQLRAGGYQVMRAATGEEGLARAAKRIPQLITLDIFLPAMDGWEFIRRLKAEPKLVDTPVVIITVSDDASHGLALGARRVLQKPFVREDLVAALAGLVAARADGEPTRVLVVDDNVKAVELVATALEAEGYRVLRAYGGAEAIATARAAIPDLVILDLMMPEVSGFEVARALRDSEATSRIPILVLTAKDLGADDRARLNGDVSVILAKATFDPTELLAEVRRASPRGAGN